ncbi:vomeronasal 1 receptor ornAnaV1R3258 [Ornithorhynchus anatinus]|uniref:Vomeronasal type-1 receptor n=1 Tax=Ornithorhynchus anatinus TaxID=9258 RepID=F6S1T0_ORNAN|nr:vomeronasal 1 receptor ornAnaV1R3258 [Ornithorhynchus anatinus]
MNVDEVSFAILLTVQIVLGASGNIVLLIFSIRSSLRPIDKIFAHLGLANTMVLLSKGIPETMQAWKLENFLDTMGCKILLYCYRVARGLSICTTSLLSVFQAITLSPRTPRWAPIKDRAPRSIGLSCLLFWILSSLLDVTVLKYVTGPQNRTRTRSVLHLKYCSSVSVSKGIVLVNSIIFTFRDLLFIGLMSGASLYMMFLLYRHHNLVRHLHGHRRPSRSTPEVQAAKCVVLLVVLYDLLYGSNSVTLNVLLNTRAESPLVLNIHTVLSFVFSAVSPLLIINGNRRPSRRRLSEE